VRGAKDQVRAMSIASYEDGGLAQVFSAMLRAPSWLGAGQLAFRHFLERHIQFDTCGDNAHGALSRHLRVDDSILPLWTAFLDILRSAVPSLAAAEVHQPTKLSKSATIIAGANGTKLPSTHIAGHSIATASEHLAGE